MAKDVLGREIKDNDILVYHYPSGSVGLKAGCLYRAYGTPNSEKIQVTGLMPVEGSNFIASEYSRYFIVIDNMPSGAVPTIDYESIANNLIKLINSKPRSPLREEIIACLRHLKS